MRLLIRKAKGNRWQRAYDWIGGWHSPDWLLKITSSRLFLKGLSWVMKNINKQIDIQRILKKSYEIVNDVDTLPSSDEKIASFNKRLTDYAGEFHIEIGENLKVFLRSLALLIAKLRGLRGD